MGSGWQSTIGAMSIVDIRRSVSDHSVSETLRIVATRKVLHPHPDRKSAHPFPAKMASSVAETIIARLSRPGARVLDPMVGSGTTVIAAKRLGRLGFGVDRDPLAVALTEAATRDFDEVALRKSSAVVLRRAKEHRAGRLSNGKEIDHLFDAETLEFIRYWFPRRAITELWAIAGAIRRDALAANRAFLWNVFSGLIISKSSGASYAIDLAHSRPHRNLKKCVTSPLEEWVPRVNSAIRRLSAESHAHGTGLVLRGDARSLPIESNSIDLVLTSPPYLAAGSECRQAIDYLRTHKFSLVWMGHNVEGLRRIRATQIGTEVGLPQRDGLPEGLEDSIRALARTSSQARMRRYLSDLHKVLGEIERVLRKDGLAVFVVGPSMLSRRRYDSADVITALAESRGLSVVSRVTRRLRADRRALPPPSRGTQRSDLRKRMHSEIFLALRKRIPEER